MPRWMELAENRPDRLVEVSPISKCATYNPANALSFLSLTHSPTHPLTHSPTHPLTHSPTHPRGQHLVIPAKAGIHFDLNLDLDLSKQPIEPIAARPGSPSGEYRGRGWHHLFELTGPRDAPELEMERPRIDLQHLPHKSKYTRSLAGSSKTRVVTLGYKTTFPIQSASPQRYHASSIIMAL